MKFSSIIFTILVFIFSVEGNAQKFTASVYGQVSVPQHEYQEINGDVGFGIRANGFYRPGKDIPLKVGLELGIQEKGRTSENFSGYLNGYDDRFRVSATNNIVSVMLITRFQQEKPNKIKPFIDLTAGWNIFYSTISVERLTYFSPYDAGYTTSSRAKWALSYGAAAGIDIPLNKKDDIGLELRIAYLLGNNTKYLSNPYIDDNAEVSFSEYNSRTDMLIPQVGVRFSL